MFSPAAKNFVPTYIKTHEEGQLMQKAKEALEILRSCAVCPRNCKVDQLANKTAMCPLVITRETSAFPQLVVQIAGEQR